MSACALVAAMLFAAPPMPEGGTKVVVVVQGDDAGKTQANLESELEKQLFRIVRGVGAKLGPAPDAAPTSVQTDKALVEIRAAQTAYDSAEFDAAQSRIDTARQLLYSTNEPAASEARTQLHLWAAAITLAAGKTDLALAEVKSLLRTDPDPKASTDVFSSELVELIEGHRPKDVVSVTLSGLPDGATVLVVPPSGVQRFERAPGFAAEKGAKLRIRAPYHRPMEIAVPSDLPSFAPPVKMALALRDDADKAMRAVLEGTATRPQIQTLQSVAQQAGADALVLAQVRGPQTRGAVVWATSSPSGVGTGDFATVAAFLSKKLRPSSGSESTQDDGLFTRGGIAFSRWNRSLDGVYDYGINGAGPSVAVDYRVAGGVLAGAELQLISYALTPIEIGVSGGAAGSETVRGAGGSAFRAALDIGYEIGAGPLFVGALVGGRYEQYSMTPVEIETAGDELAALGSSTYSGATARARVRYPLGDATWISASAGAVISPSYSEDPEGTSGQDPEAATAPFWTLGASWDPGDTLRIGFDYAGEMRSIEMTGTPLVDRRGSADENPTLNELVNTFQITAAYRF